MDIFLLTVNVIVFIALGSSIYFFRKAGLSFSMATLVAIVLGIGFGLALKSIYAGNESLLADSYTIINGVASLYVNALKMLGTPLVFLAITSTILGLSGKNNIGKIFFRIVAVLLGTTLIAAIIAISVSSIFNLDGSYLLTNEDVVSRGEKLLGISGRTGLENIVKELSGIVPTNIFSDFAGMRSSSLLGVVFFSFLMGFAGLKLIQKNPESGNLFKRIILSFKDVVMTFAMWIIMLTPYGVFALMAKFIMYSNWQSIQSLGEFVLAIYIALLATFVFHLAVITWGLKLNPFTYIAKAWPTLVYAFSSRSSLGTLPLTMTTQRKLGVNNSIAELSSSLGTTLGQNGCGGVYPAIVAILGATIIGIDPFSIVFLVKLLFAVLVTSFAIVGIGSGATYATIMLLTILGLPIELAALLIAIEPLVDMGRTALNVNGSILSGLVTAKSLDQIDEEVYNKRESDINLEA